MAKRKRPATKTEAEAPETALVRVNIARQAVTAPTFVSLYANDVQIQTTPWDVRLIFGHVTSHATPENPSTLVTLTGEARMSPQLAKRVTMLLMMQLQKYEHKFGPIPQPQPEE